MKLYTDQVRKTVAVMCLFLTVSSGCAMPGVKTESAKTVTPGDVADISFLCRLKTGEIVAATDRAVGQQTELPKSAVFLQRGKDGPVYVRASASLPALVPPRREWAFEEEIINRLAGTLIGMKEGESRTVELTASDLPDRSQQDYVLNIASVRERLKEIHMPVAEYLSRTGKSPEAGQPFVLDPSIPGRVEDVTPEEVVIIFIAKPGDVVQTPFGPGHIRETEKTYEIEIDARKGALVRSGPLVGRITGVDDMHITLDYRNPFGGETLLCNVTVGKITDAKSIKGEAGK